MQMEPVYLLVYPATHIIQCQLRRMYIHIVIGNGVNKVRYAKFIVSAHTISPDAPNEQGPHYYTVFLEICLQIDNLLVIKRSTRAGTMQPWCIAHVVFYGIHIGVKHIVAPAQGFAQRGLALQQPVIVGIHTCYHIWSEIVHHGCLFSFAKCGSGWQHYLKMHTWSFVFVQHIAPESYIAIALHINHNGLFAPAWLKLIGRRNVVGRYV